MKFERITLSTLVLIKFIGWLFQHEELRRQMGAGNMLQGGVHSTSIGISGK